MAGKKSSKSARNKGDHGAEMQAPAEQARVDVPAQPLQRSWMSFAFGAFQLWALFKLLVYMLSPQVRSDEEAGERLLATSNPPGDIAATATLFINAFIFLYYCMVSDGEVWQECDEQFTEVAFLSNKKDYDRGEMRFKPDAELDIFTLRRKGQVIGIRQQAAGRLCRRDGLPLAEYYQRRVQPIQTTLPKTTNPEKKSKKKSAAKRSEKTTTRKQAIKAAAEQARKVVKEQARLAEAEKAEASAREVLQQAEALKVYPVVDSAARQPGGHSKFFRVKPLPLYVQFVASDPNCKYDPADGTLVSCRR
ncbi:MAG: hypothetical protein COB66_07370 [Coxiella sp. (in: Bacteria)]|nr:MAG: hypothetical protein COB66_07370 [Coxiella sp. (in: g-proteobacteria)]